MFEPKELHLTVKSYAKINLALDIVGVRDDGYHMLETVMQKIRLADRIDVSWQPSASGGIHISLSTNKPYLPTDERNLAYRAALMMAEYAGINGKLKISVTKRIPVSAGLGGGSSNAAALMVALNKLWRLKLNTRKLCDMGKALGADVPFLILVHNTSYECALCRGTGDELTALKRSLRKYIVLAKPGFGVSTAEVFKGIDECTVAERPNIEQLTEGIRTRNRRKVLDNMTNVLEAYTCSAYPQVERLKAEMRRTDRVRRVLMTGSGPTVIAVYDTYAAARRACAAIRKKGYEAYWTQTTKEIGGQKYAEF